MTAVRAAPTLVAWRAPRWVQIALVGAIVVLGASTLHYLQNGARFSTSTAGAGGASGGPSYTTTSITPLTSSTATTLNPDEALVYEQWKHTLGCTDETLHVCQAKIDTLVAKEAQDLHYWNKRVAESLARNSVDSYQHIPLIDSHPALTLGVYPEYQANPEWLTDHSYPDLNVIGLAKTGTSQLYKILKEHAETVAFHPKKEYCMYGANKIVWEDAGEVAALVTTETVRQVQENLFTWRTTLARQAVERTAAYTTTAKQQHQNSPPQTVNGCLNLHDLWLDLHYAPSTTSKYLILLRDPADWLYASFNFFVDANLDARETGGSKLWTKTGVDYRSPELFHEFIVAGHQTITGRVMLDRLRQQTVTTGRRLTALVGSDNVLFLKNEDMLPENIDNANGFLDHLSNFTGLDRFGFREQTLHSMMNCNDNKGLKTECNQDVAARGSYEIAGGRKMLNKTRAFIYLQYREECQIWANEFRVVYPDCLNVLAAE